MEIFLFKKFRGVWWRDCQYRATSAGGATGIEIIEIRYNCFLCECVIKENDVLCVFSLFILSINFTP